MIISYFIKADKKRLIMQNFFENNNKELKAKFTFEINYKNSKQDMKNKNIIENLLIVLYYIFDIFYII